MSPHRGRFPVQFLVMLAIPVVAWSLPWDRDMQNQPSVKAQESVVETDSASVPVGNQELFSVPNGLIELVRARLVAGEKLVNPIASSPGSLERGRQLYEVHCLVCHGAQGQGDGPVGQKFVPQPMDLRVDYVQFQPDGQLYYTISHGSIVMPYYRQAILAEDRWNLVNYIKQAMSFDE